MTSITHLNIMGAISNDAIRSVIKCAAYIKKALKDLDVKRDRFRLPQNL